MSSIEIASVEGDDGDVGLTTRQVVALERLTELGAEPAVIDSDTGKAIYHSNPQIRAQQLIFEGKFGGAGRGQGRPKQSQRAAEVMADEIRKSPRVKKMLRVIDRGLSKKAGVRANLDTVKLAMEIENKERSLQIREEEHDSQLGTKEDLIVAFLEAATNPGFVAALEKETAITDAEFVEITDDSDTGNDSTAADIQPTEATRARPASASEKSRSNGDSATVKKAGNNRKNLSNNKRVGATRPYKPRGKPVIKVKSRRPAK